MGMSHEINGNNCYLSQTTLHVGLNAHNCGSQLVWSQSSVPAMPQLISGLDLNSLNQFNTTFNALDLNRSLLINTNELSNDGQTQQILLVSSPMDLMAVQASQQSLMAKPVHQHQQQPQQVQMVLQTTDLPMMSSGGSVNVIQMPTNLLLTDNNLIVIPQEGLTLEVPAMESSQPMQQSNESQLCYDNKSQTAIVYNGSIAPQLLTAGQQIQYTNGEQLVVNLNDCIAINAVDDKSNANQYYPINAGNHQIFGIIDANTNEPKLLATEHTGDDLNAFLASSLTPTAEPECDPNEAKGWYNDSMIAYRAMAAFKRVMPNTPVSPTSGVRLHK